MTSSYPAFLVNSTIVLCGNRPVSGFARRALCWYCFCCGRGRLILIGGAGQIAGTGEQAGFFLVAGIGRMSSREIWQNRVTKELEALGRPIARCAHAPTRSSLRLFAGPFLQYAGKPWFARRYARRRDDLGTWNHSLNGLD
jgi:hypothetical protein